MYSKSIGSDIYILTFEPIPPESIELIYKGSGNDKLKRNWRKNRIVEELDLKSNPLIFWHGTASQDLRGGLSGLHLGTYEAAKIALEATIGIPVKGEWDGKREYGKTKLSGKKRLRTGEKGKYRISGYNCDIPDDDFFPVDNPYKAKYSNGEEISLKCKPIIFPCKIVGPMTNTIHNPHSDDMANSMMKGQLKKGNAKKGYYYINDVEDSGSISVVVPNYKHIEIMKNVSENVTPKTRIEDEIDRLMDKGYKNLTPDEQDFLKNPYKSTEEPKEEPKKEILKYYSIAEDFFRRVLSTDVRNYELNDNLDIFDIVKDDNEAFDVANTIYYKYGIQIDPENNDEFKLVNIFKKINSKIK
jgi:hypothetical protein